MKNYFKRNRHKAFFLVAMTVFIAGALFKAGSPLIQYEISIALLLVFAALAAFAAIKLSSCAKKLSRRKKYLGSTLCQIDRMAGGEFEELLVAHFEKNGYKANATPKSGDYGADLIIRGSGAGRDFKGHFAIQAKRSKGKVGIKAVQEILGGMAYYGCPKGMVITNNYFTRNAWELAKKSNVILWDRNHLSNVFGIKAN
ncbi:MAG: restriction endonuclease [Lachnospiraceae bacterium]|nr:restriction endonuclease [Lachnospiraceae bacterium]